MTKEEMSLLWVSIQRTIFYPLILLFSKFFWNGYYEFICVCIYIYWVLWTNLLSLVNVSIVTFFPYISFFGWVGSCTPKKLSIIDPLVVTFTIDLSYHKFLTHLFHRKLNCSYYRICCPTPFFYSICFGYF